MTYVLAWRTSEAAFLVADSAVTTTTTGHGRSRPTDNNPLSSFGQRSVDEAGRVVREGAIKIHHLGHVALALSGNAYWCHSASAQIAARITGGTPVRQALRSVLIDTLPPDAFIGIAAAFVENGSPSLLIFESASGGFREPSVGELIHLGNASELYRGFSEVFLREQITRMVVPEIMLAAALAWLNGYGLRDYSLFEMGIGGTFLGLICRSSGFVWQPDLLFLPTNESGAPIGAVSSLVRDNVHLVESTLNELVTLSVFGSESEGLVGNQESRTGALAEARTGMVDFVVLLSAVAASAIIIHMNRVTAHSELVLQSRRVAWGTQLSIQTEANLSRQLNELPPDRPGRISFKFIYRRYEPLRGDVPAATWPKVSGPGRGPRFFGSDEVELDPDRTWPYEQGRPAAGRPAWPDVAR